jgi:hypothetical protein
MSNHNSTGTFKTVLETLGAEKERSVSWADVVKGVGHSPDAKERVATATDNEKYEEHVSRDHSIETIQ